MLYDPDVAVIRMIEAYHATKIADKIPVSVSRIHGSSNGDGDGGSSSSSASSSSSSSGNGTISHRPTTTTLPHTKVYLLAYEGSAEQHRFTESLRREKKAFEGLIDSKRHMVISLPDYPEDLMRGE